MKVEDELTANGSPQPATLASRLRDLADAVEASAEAITLLGGNPAVKDGQTLVFKVTLEATL